MKLLIVNADDYGLTDGVSAGILRAHREGIVTSTSVLAVGPALEDTAAWLREHPSLGLGAHLAAVGEDPPLLTPKQVPSLVDDDGCFPPTWKAFLQRAVAGRIDLDELEAEFDAQIVRLQGLGLVLDHVDTHQHLHLWPAVNRVVRRVASRHGINAMRVIQPSSIWSLTGAGTAALGRLARRDAEREAMAVPETAWGLDEAGGIDTDRLIEGLETLAGRDATSFEIATHPGEADDPARDRYRWGYEWAGELDALCSPRVVDAVRRLGFTLGTFGELVETDRLQGVRR